MLGWSCHVDCLYSCSAYFLDILNIYKHFLYYFFLDTNNIYFVNIVYIYVIKCIKRQKQIKNKADILCMCMYIYIYIYNNCTHTCIYTYIHTLYIYIYIYIYICVYICIYTCMCTIIVYIYICEAFPHIPRQQMEWKWISSNGQHVSGHVVATCRFEYNL